MARKRKKKSAGQAESLQVELLQDAEPEAAPAEVEPQPLSLDPRPESREPGDRWARAAGQLKPTRHSERRRPEVEGAGGALPVASVPDAPDAGEEAVPAPQRLPGKRAKAARDHASAGLRPAGEPLARARDLVQSGRIHEAIELYLGILTVNPSNLKAHNNIGVLLDELKQFDVALEHFEAAERLAPDNVEILANFASTLTSLARYEEAEELLRRAQRLAPDDIQARLGIGILYFRRGLYGQAESELGWVCGRDENNGVAFYYRGEALNRLSRYDEAAEALERAAALIPTDPRPFYTLGHLYDRRHQLEDAADMYRRARRLQTP